MFLTLAAPTEVKDGNQHYGWNVPKKFLGVKLGYADILAFNTALEGKPAPEAVAKNALVNLYHKDAKNATQTLINLSDKDGKFYLRLSRSKDEAFQIELSVSEMKALKSIIGTFVPLMYRNPLIEGLKANQREISELRDQVQTLTAMVAELLKGKVSVA